MSITCARRIQFCCGHRVLGHESKCANPHGHNFVAMIHAIAKPENQALDSIGRVIDFSVLKEKVGGWIDEHWDHTFLVNKEDTALIYALEVKLSKNKPTFICPFNPTSEEMADYLLRTVCPTVLEGTGVEVFKVELWETENCKATAERSLT